jgi:hypothetical protein
LQTCRVRIKISDKGDVVPGTGERKVTISGRHDAVQLAQLMMSQKIQQSQASRAGDGRPMRSDRGDRNKEPRDLDE